MNLNETLRASEADRLVNCPGSYGFRGDTQDLYKDADRTAADMGVDKHKMIETLLTDSDVVTDAPHDVIAAYDAIRANFSIPRDAQFELDVSDALQSFMPNNRCRIDAVWFEGVCRELVICDFKFGYSKVSAFLNWQLINGAVGCLAAIPKDKLLPDTIRFVIVQPNCPNADGSIIDQWIIRLDGFRALAAQLKAAYKQAVSGQGKRKAGSHCKYCTMRHSCATLREANRTLIDYIENDEPFENNRVDRLSNELDLLERFEELIKIRKTGLETVLKSRLKFGFESDKYELAESLGNREWVDGVDKLLEAILDNPYKTVLYSPNECEQKGVDKSIVRRYTVRKSRGFTLKRKK